MPSGPKWPSKFNDPSFDFGPYYAKILYLFNYSSLITYSTQFKYVFINNFTLLLSAYYNRATCIFVRANALLIQLGETDQSKLSVFFSSIMLNAPFIATSLYIHYITRRRASIVSKYCPQSLDGANMPKRLFKRRKSVRKISTSGLAKQNFD